jgi:hypothetical protein
MSAAPERVSSVSLELVASQAIGARARKSLPLVLGSVLVVAFSALFARPWWNWYLGLTNEGWYQFFGNQILQGRIPYRDFHLFVPPIQALVMASLTKIFGTKLIVPEVFGFIGIVAISFVLYLWLTRLFPSFWVTVAVVATAAVYLRYNSESLSGLHIDVNLCAALAMLCPSFALSGRPATSFLAGVVAGITFMTKQTAGAAVTASIGAALPVLLAPTLSYVHFIDETPDDVFRRDAETLREHPPAVILFTKYDEAKLREGEINWRNGRRSGERALAAGVESLRNQYKFIDVLQIPYTGRRFEVWARQ